MPAMAAAISNALAIFRFHRPGASSRKKNASDKAVQEPAIASRTERATSKRE